MDPQSGGKSPSATVAPLLSDRVAPSDNAFTPNTELNVASVVLFVFTVTSKVSENLEGRASLDDDLVRSDELRKMRKGAGERRRPRGGFVPDDDGELKRVHFAAKTGDLGDLRLCLAENKNCVHWTAVCCASHP